MAKTGPNFKLSKSAKRIVALMKNASPEQRNGWKRMFIDAEYTASIVPKVSKKERTGGNYTTTSTSATAVE